MYRRLSLGFIICAFAWVSACSLLNSPDDPVPAGEGGGGDGGDQGGTGGATAECTVDGDCEDGDNCTIDTCDDDGSCAAEAVDPDDGDVCTDDSCDADGTPLNEPIDPDDGDACTIDWCDPVDGEFHVADRAVFEHDFSDATGWLLNDGVTTGPWQIGPAVPSGVSVRNQATQYLRDPAEDHSPSGDNGLAGLIIGGFAPVPPAGVPLAPPVYLESPEFDATIQQGELILSYWRVLVSDDENYMAHTVDVWDGAAWQTVFTNEGSATFADTQWQLVNHNITAYANAQMKVRFGYETLSSSAYRDLPSWSIDDIKVYNAALDIVDDDMCTEDLCDPVDGVLNPTLELDDMNACTLDECDPVLGPRHADESIVFMADFSSPEGHWPGSTFSFLTPGAPAGTDPEWEIAPASVSSGNGPDPAADATPSDDNMLAGVNVGGQYSVDNGAGPITHGFYYLVTPSFTPDADVTTLTVQYRRWLNSDYPPYVTNVVEVNQAGTISTVWQDSSTSTIADTQWQTIEHENVTFTTEVPMALRFGFDVGSGAIAYGGWNVDDIVVRDPSCDTP